MDELLSKLIDKFSIDKKRLAKYFGVTKETLDTEVKLDFDCEKNISEDNAEEIRKLIVIRNKTLKLFNVEDNDKDKLIALEAEQDKIKIRKIKKQIKVILGNHKLFRFIQRDNDNLLSFLCGIFSNIPISLLFTINKVGTNCWEHAYFIAWISAFIFSLVVTASAFAITLKKMNLKKGIENENDTDAFNILDFHYKYKNLKQYFIGGLIAFIIATVFLVFSAIGLWIIYNFIPQV